MVLLTARRYTAYVGTNTMERSLPPIQQTNSLTISMKPIGVVEIVGNAHIDNNLWELIKQEMEREGRNSHNRYAGGSEKSKTTTDKIENQNWQNNAMMY